MPAEMNPPHRSPLEGHVRLYEEQWQADHALALGCRELEDTLKLGVALGETIVANVLRWREAVARGLEPYRQEDETTALDLLRLWCQVCERVLPCVARYEPLYDVVEHAAEFREREAQMRELLAGWKPPALQRAVGLQVQEWTVAEAEEAEALIARGLPRLPRLPRSLGESAP